MSKRLNPHFLNDILRESRGNGAGSRRIMKAMDAALTRKPRMSGADQTRVEMEIRDELSRRKGLRPRWPF